VRGEKKCIRRSGGVAHRLVSSASAGLGSATLPAAKEGKREIERKK